MKEEDKPRTQEANFKKKNCTDYILCILDQTHLFWSLCGGNNIGLFVDVSQAVVVAKARGHVGVGEEEGWNIIELESHLSPWIVRSFLNLTIKRDKKGINYKSTTQGRT